MRLFQCPANASSVVTSCTNVPRQFAASRAREAARAALRSRGSKHVDLSRRRTSSTHHRSASRDALILYSILILCVLGPAIVTAAPTRTDSSPTDPCLGQNLSTITARIRNNCSVSVCGTFTVTMKQLFSEYTKNVFKNISHLYETVKRNSSFENIGDDALSCNGTLSSLEDVTTGKTREEALMSLMDDLLKRASVMLKLHVSAEFSMDPKQRCRMLFDPAVKVKDICCEMKCFHQTITGDTSNTAWDGLTDVASNTDIALYVNVHEEDMNAQIAKHLLCLKRTLDITKQYFDENSGHFWESLAMPGVTA